jgi:hypothetical protein
MVVREGTIRRRAVLCRLQDVAAFKAEVHKWALKIGVQPKRVQVQSMRKKWASCSRAGRLCFSKDLFEEDAAFRVVVIVHELLHLQVPNHGKLFKSLMNAYVPGWERVLQGRSACLYGYTEMHARGRRFRGHKESGGIREKSRATRVCC